MQNARLQLGQLLRRKPLERLRNLLAEITVHFFVVFSGGCEGFYICSNGVNITWGFSWFHGGFNGTFIGFDQASYGDLSTVFPFMVTSPQDGGYPKLAIWREWWQAVWFLGYPVFRQVHILLLSLSLYDDFAAISINHTDRGVWEWRIYLVHGQSYKYEEHDDNAWRSLWALYAQENLCTCSTWSVSDSNQYLYLA